MSFSKSILFSRYTILSSKEKSFLVFSFIGWFSSKHILKYSSIHIMHPSKKHLIHFALCNLFENYLHLKHLILYKPLFFFQVCSHVIFINSSLNRSDSVSKFSLSLFEFSFSSFMLTMLYIVYVLLLKSPKFHSKPAKFSALIAFGLTIHIPLLVNKFTISSTFIFTLLSA